MKHGFSLVELSIVLVILGLLTGGILAGQSLIRASELRAASTEYARFATATNTFRDKYFSMPADFRDATRFWGRLSTTDCATNSSASVVATGTCDGGGDGNLWGTVREYFTFWQQLALAGLIEGSYSQATGGGGSYHSVPGTNVPRSKLNNAGWSVSYTNSAAGDGALFAVALGNHFILGANSGTDSTRFAALKPEEAWNIDTKMDDGKPGAGKVIGYYWNSACASASSNTDYAANYNLSNTSIQCSLFFVNQF